MHNFKEAFDELNPEQQQAVENIDGPLLVLAGPGTGKTQLLSVRVANILDKTDTPPENILCLTFTESGARNMRDRLSKLIGTAAYDVNIGTYHAFGGDMIRRYPEYFSQTRLQSPVDDLGRHNIIAKIIDKTSYLNPLKQTRHHLGDLLATISEVKRALLTPDQLRLLSAEVTSTSEKLNPQITKIFESFTKMPRKLDQATSYFEQLLTALATVSPKKPAVPRFGTLVATAHNELLEALEQAQSTSKTTPLTKYKNKWLAKNSDNQFVLTGELQNKRLLALADVLESYQAQLETAGLYDFDDMILKVIAALERHPDLKYTLQERYLYVLLDEFQDTNAAQLKIVELLTDNPVNEGRPNVMAVGDDDQAIYAFQGASYSNMLDFHRLYIDTKVINLTENYRSHKDILHVAHNLASQIENRLHHQLKEVNKLLSANVSGEDTAIERYELVSDIDQYDWLAKDIAKQIKNGVDPDEIAVLAPKHRYLEPLVPHLNKLGVPVRYEKRENILESKVVHQLTTMSRLVIALENQNETLADSLWPEVLSYEFWSLNTESIWKTSWKVNDTDGKKTWTQILLEQSSTKSITELMLNIASKVKTETLETMLDYLSGSQQLDKELVSPLKDFYSSQYKQKNQPEVFYETLSHLTVIRTKLREHQQGTSQVLKLPDFIKFIEQYEAADQRMINTSPYNQAASAVQLMTVFKAKGLEFEHVYLPSCNDQTWGESSRTNNNMLTLPANLLPIRHAGATNDERLRILFVAATRAKQRLVLASFAQTFSGKSATRLKYLDETEQDQVTKSNILPNSTKYSLQSQTNALSIDSLESNWYSKHLAGIASTQLKHLLQSRLDTYQLSPTHLNSFTDLTYGGPQSFFFNTILRFPGAPTPAGQFGNAVHETMQWLQEVVTKDKKLPTIKQSLEYFDKRLSLKRLPEHEHKLMTERGHHAIKTFLNQRGSQFKPTDKAEHNFKNEAVFVDDVHLSGKIDRMEIDKETKQIVVVDYKTGPYYDKWASSVSLHKYRQQLYCYKLLIEASNSFKGYSVATGRLEFVEPDSNGKIHTLDITFNETELERTKQLVKAVWKHVKALDFPDVSDYKSSVAGTKQFENDLIK